MKQPAREAISALLDDEANEMDLQRILNALESDDDVAQAWQRYHLVSASLREEVGPFGHIDLSCRVREALADDTSDHSAHVRSRGFGGWVKPFASVAVAASVTAAILTSTQLYNASTANGASTEAALAVNGNVSPLMAGSQTVGFGNSHPSQPASRSLVVEPRAQAAADDMARQRLEFYLRNNAENASLNTSSGLMPLARAALAEER